MSPAIVLADRPLTERKPHAPPPRSGHRQPCRCLRCADDRLARGVKPLGLVIGGRVIEALPPLEPRVILETQP